MEETRDPDVQAFEQFKTTMRKLFSVSKADLDARLKENKKLKAERRADSKPTRRKV